MAENYKYKAFISYSHKDKNFAKWLHKRIENYKIPNSLREKYPNLPKNLQRSVFRDEDELPTASELSDNLLHAMDTSERLIVICSPSSVKSKWVNSEIKYFKHKHGENSVLAVIKDGEPNATDMDDRDDEAFPHALRYIVNEEGNLTEERTEPIAGDARSYWDKEMALMKMIAGILKVDFADLWRRERRERNKRRFIALGIVSVFIALSIYASTQFFGDKVNKELEQVKNDIAMVEYSIRHDSLDQETIIELNKELKRLKELKKNKEATLESFGHLKSSLGKEAHKVYQYEGAQEAIKVLTSRDALSRKERLKKELSLEDITLAKLYVETNQFDKAQQSYEDAIEIFFDFDNVMEYASFLYNQKCHLRAIKLYEKLLESQLTKREKGRVYLGLGNATYSRTTYAIKETNKKMNEAERAFQKSLLIFRDLAEKTLEDKRALSTSLNNLSVFYRGINKLEKAEKLIYESIKLNEQLVGLDKQNNKFNSSLALSLYNKGVLLAIQKQYKQAEYFYNKSLSIYENLLLDNPDAYNPSVAMVWGSLGILYKTINNDLDKEIAYKKSLLKYTKMAKTNPEAYCSGFETATSNLAKFYEENMNFNEAEHTYIKALDVCNNYPKFLPFNNSLIKSKLNTLYYNSGQLVKLEKSYEDFKRTKTKKFHAGEPTILRYLAQLYINANETDKAKQSYIKEIKIYKGLVKNGDKKTKFQFIQFPNYSSISNRLVRLYFLYKKDNQSIEAKKAYADVLTIYENFKKVNNFKYNRYEIFILQDIAKLQINNFEIDKAKQSYITAIEILLGYIKEQGQKGINIGKKSDQSSLAWIHNRLGELYEKDKELAKAGKAYVKALNIYKGLAKGASSNYNKDIVWTISRLGNMYKQNIELEKAEKYYDIALSILPSTYNDKIAYEFDMLGKLYEKNKKFNEAEKVYIKSLSIYNGLAEKNKKVYNTYISWVLGRIGEIYSETNQYAKAIEMHSSALVILESEENKTTKTYNDLLWTLSRLGELYEENSQNKKAKEVYTKALTISTELAKKDVNYNADIASITSKLKAL